jgi:hypothetical protein
MCMVCSRVQVLFLFSLGIMLHMVNWTAFDRIRDLTPRIAERPPTQTADAVMGFVADKKKPLLRNDDQAGSDLVNSRR